VPRRLSPAQTVQLAVLAAFSVVVAGCGSFLGEDNGPPPDPFSEDVVAARALATTRADEALADAAAALDGRVVARTTADACYEGQNNYKRREGFDHRCTIRRAIVVGLDGDFPRRIARFDRRLFAAGWNCGAFECDRTLSGLVDEYWGFRKGEHGGQDPPISSLPTTSSYQRDGLYLEVGYLGADPAGRGALGRFHRRWRGGLFTSFERERPFDVDAVLARARDAKYVVGLAIETDYFEDDDIG
jgi:hypothetical protein